MWRSALHLIRGAMPALIIATFIPVALFYTVLTLGSVMWAIAVSVVYAYAVAAYQWYRHRRVSGMLLVTVFMATLRAFLAVVSGHAMLYFAIPVVETAGFGLMFLATMFSSEPLIVKLARDLVPSAADGLAARRSLIRSLSVVWTIVYIGSGATTLILLTTTPMSFFIGAHTLTGWIWTGSGAAATVLICRARAQGLWAAVCASAREAADSGRRGATPALAPAA